AIETSPHRSRKKKTPLCGVFRFQPRLPTANTAGTPRCWPEPAAAAPCAPIAPAAAPRAAMPAKSATASHLRDKRLLLQRKKRGRERPGVEGNKRHHTAGRYSGWF